MGKNLIEEYSNLQINFQKQNETTQPALSVPGTSPKCPLKVLMSDTYRELSWNFQKTNRKFIV